MATQGKPNQSNAAWQAPAARLGNSSNLTSKSKADIDENLVIKKAEVQNFIQVMASTFEAKPWTFETIYDAGKHHCDRIKKRRHENNENVFVGRRDNQYSGH